jgi:hypothetical protein
LGQQIADRPTIDDLSQWLEAPLADALRIRNGKLEFSPLSSGNKVADGTTVLLLRNTLDRSLRVVLCSPPVSPDMVKRAMDRAHLARSILGASAAAPILDPLAQGRVQGLSYAVLPYCHNLSESRSVWWLQRALLRPSIFNWLRQITECTMRDAERASIEHDFTAPLQRIVWLTPLRGRLRAAASRAIERINEGAWVPKLVLMHGDLWKGNILIRPQDNILRRIDISNRFVITDWAGSEVSGYAIYDLVRLADSMHLNARNLQREVERHCSLLGCEPVDATSYLMAALGHIAMNLEHFPIDRYTHMADSCYAILEHALASRQDLQAR